MSDMLEKLLHAEKGAEALIVAAEAEAKQRVAKARAEAQKKHAALLKTKTDEGEAAAAAEREKIAAERKRKTEEYRGKLAATPVHRDAFFKAVRGFMEKGGA
jgi:vacuolar-type H+-ATPase subunit H